MIDLKVWTENVMGKHFVARIVGGGIFLVVASTAYADSCNTILSALKQETTLTQTKQTEGKQTTEFARGPNASLSVSCTLSAPNIAVTWDGPNPDVAFYDLVGAAGNLVTHRPAAEVVKFSKQCRQEALKDNTEIATIERKGMAIECQAFERDGGGTTITVFAE